MTTTPATTPTPALDRFFTSLRRSPVTRSQDRVVAGVAAGIADRLGVSRPIVRVALVALGIFGPGVLLYLLAWLMLPDAQGQIRLERAIRGGDGASIVLLIVGGFAVLGALFGDEVGRGAGMHGDGGFWPLLIIAGIALIGFKKGWWQRHGSHGGHGGHQQGPTPTPTTPSTPSTPSTPNTPDSPQDAPHA
jgi:phage shock protein PspC (stress-responsive transcriptional regulator)